jgi:hypothetical protein
MARAGSPIKRTDRSFDFLEAERARSSSASDRADGESVRNGRGFAAPVANPVCRQGASPQAADPANVAEQRLLTALKEHSGAGVNALAKGTGERLRGLASRGVVTKDSAGHWRLVAELAGEAAGPTLPPSP